MSKSFDGGLNGFTRKRRRRRCAPAEQIERCETHEAYACLSSAKSSLLKVTLPCEKAPVVFDECSRKQGMEFEPGSAELRVCMPGDYGVDFALYLYCDVSALCSFIIEADGKAVKGGTFTGTTERGHQVCCGWTIENLKACERIRLVFTAPSAMQVSVVNAVLSAAKL